MPLVTFTDAGGDSIQFMQIDGVNYPYIRNKDQEAAIQSLRQAAARDNDVLLVNYPKSGTHWLWEVLGMLYNGEAKTIQNIKQSSFLEAMSVEQLTSLPPPRIINTHMPFKHLPTDMVSRQTKIILIHRNPKDVAVSLYNHLTHLKFFNYSGKWENFLPMFLEGKVEYCLWFDYVRYWEKVMDEHPDYPIHLMFYEDMKENSAREIEKVAEFLDLPVSKQVCGDIADKCQFSKMVKDKEGLEDDFWKSVWRDNTPCFYRKGEVGDWKNWFTVDQNEAFDKVYQEKMADSKLKFRFRFEI